MNLHMCNARSKIIIITRTQEEQMSLKFGKAIRTLRRRQNYLVLIKKVYHDIISQCGYYLFDRSGTQPHLLVQSQQYKHQSNVQNLFGVINKGNGAKRSSDLFRGCKMGTLTKNSLISAKPTDVVWMTSIVRFLQFFTTGCNQFHTACLFVYPLKTLENQRFSDVFRGYRKRPVA